MQLRNRTISLGRVYVCLAAQAASSPLIYRSRTVEKEGKYRTGDGWLVRLPFTGHRPTTGLVLGIWRKRAPVRKDAVIIVGAQGLGKSLNAEAMCVHYGCERFVEDWDGETKLTPGMLVITNDEETAGRLALAGCRITVIQYHRAMRDMQHSMVLRNLGFCRRAIAGRPGQILYVWERQGYSYPPDVAQQPYYARKAAISQQGDADVRKEVA